ncbi:flagellar hook capping FlgD N-terminal domain-containing protein [Paracoccus sp. TOH]|uniref:Basal-body rod modification protein FlgD n=1 Tax=Paracoccus simplex TaxID=2086346 RepID=A0ABV7RZ50_9RHOB|nr:flagellar hook capping FlgD N-terminal domain-containing protein [Paracoccus sp. TOH]WJS83851.1 flagellar basal body rod modification protein [Paracoccus sp. TOH]
MTSITNTSGLGYSSSQPTLPSGTAQAEAASQFETFLKMLTTQIKNQDPLNPMEGTEFAVQLATFSGVEQQVQTNLLLKQLLQGSGGGELGRLSDWIGREVRTSAPVWFDRSPLTLQIDGVANAEAMTLVTLDEQGNEILRESIGLGSGEVDWQGKRANGELLPAGLYSFRVEATKDGEVLSTRNVGAYTRVTGVELAADGARLVLLGGGVATVEDISALRE